MFYSAIAQDDITRKIDRLPNQSNPAFWHVVPVRGGVELHFALLNKDTDPMGRIICALTQSPVYHVETYIDDALHFNKVTAIAEKLLDLPYDFAGALCAWKDTGYHVEGHEFCSGMAGKIVGSFMLGLTPYPSPGRLLMDVSNALGRGTFMVKPLPPDGVPLGDEELDLLEDLRERSRISTATVQEIEAVCAIIEDVRQEEGQ